MRPLKPRLAIGTMNVRHHGNAAQTPGDVAVPTGSRKVRVNKVNALALDETTKFENGARIDLATRVPGIQLNVALFQFVTQRCVALGDYEYSMPFVAQAADQAQEIFFGPA
jgi:hypothetical protein